MEHQLQYMSDVDFDYNDERTGVSFDLSAASQASQEGAEPRFLLGCFNRCFCSWEIDDLTIQPIR